MDVVTALPLLGLGLLVGVLAGVLVGARWGRREDQTITGVLTSRGEDQAVIRDGLDRLHDRMQDLEQQRVSWQSQLHQQVDDVRHSTESLRRETSALATALRKPAVRGQWGELHLRRSVELAGMVAHSDFHEQVHLANPDGARRPDLVVHLAGGKSVVVDAKVPLDAYLDALAAGDRDDQGEHLHRHVRQVRAHVDSLAQKSYWQSLAHTPEFVVMFLPAESFLSAALETDPGLIEYAASRDVMLATPTTLIAMLRTIAHGWRAEKLAEHTREIHELGRDLHSRLGVMGSHLDRLGRALKAATDAYNRTVGSLESRVLVTARQFEDLGVAGPSRHGSHQPEGGALAAPAPVEEAPRPLTAVELLEELSERREELELPGPRRTARRAEGA
ncbi:MAG: DNA recombination protein RmuC [Actinomycetota bacterium]|nr:DNA recombination protein RmuC [Actinomycetota bacterium]